LCVGLRDKKYYILNQPVSREEFEKTIKKLENGYPGESFPQPELVLYAVPGADGGALPSG
jgi:hypothetical protein